MDPARIINYILLAYSNLALTRPQWNYKFWLHLCKKYHLLSHLHIKTPSSTVTYRYRDERFIPAVPP